MKDLPDWRVETGELHGDFTFKNFTQAFAFITQIALEAEKMDHHPTWTNAYNRVSFSFCTHDAGNQITDLDTKMAGIISRVATLYL